MKDNEYYVGTEEWPVEKDEPATLDESVIQTLKRRKEETSETKKARKKKADMLQKSAGMVIGAVAIAVVAGTISSGSGSSYICPVCYTKNCDFWYDYNGYEILRINPEEEMYTKRTDDESQMGIFEDNPEITFTDDTYGVTMADGTRAYLYFYRKDNIPYSADVYNRRNRKSGEKTTYISQMLSYNKASGSGESRERTDVYTVIELIYSENGDEPEKEVIYQEKNLPYVYLEKSDVSDYIWIRVASNDPTIDCEAIMDACTVYTVDSSQNYFDLGSTMRFYETDNHKRIWNDKYNSGYSRGHSDTVGVVNESFRHVNYNIDGSDGCELEFISCTYEDLYEEWHAQKDEAQRAGHTVICQIYQLYQLADFEYNGITYQTYLRDVESILNKGYDVLVSPAQENNFAVTLNVSDIMVDTTALDRLDGIQEVLTESDYSKITNILDCIFLKDDEPGEEWYAKNNNSDEMTETAERNSSEINDQDSVSDVDDKIENLPSRNLGNGLIDMSEFVLYGKANGGIIPVSRGYDSMLLDYQGNEVASYVRGYPWGMPTESGYCILTDSDKESDTYYIVDAKGKLIFYWSGSSGLMDIGENGIFYLKQYTGSGYQITYYNSDGSVLYEAEESADNDDSWYEKGTVFYDGAAYMSLYKEGFSPGVELDSPDGKGTVYLYKLTENGEAEKIDTGYRFIIDDHVDGYMVMYDPVEYDYQLYDVQTKKSSDFMRNVAASILYEDKTSVSEDAVITSWRNETFEAGNIEYYHYQTYGVLHASYGSESKDVLFDYFDVKDEKLSKAIAVYDEIVLNNYDYLLAKEDEAYFFIDLSGKVVSDTYQMATSFNDDGYAVIVEDGVASVINDQFKVMTVIEDVEVEYVACYGDVFKINDTDGEEYLYYYEVK